MEDLLAKGLAHAEELVHGGLVRRRERILVEVGAGDPAIVRYGERAKVVPEQVAFVEEEVDDVVVVRVTDEAYELPALDLDPEAMQYLAAKRLRVGLARLHSTPGELPEERKDRRGTPLRDQVLAVTFYDGR